MKQCAYCGKEYPDDATRCAIDASPLKPVIPAPQPLPVPLPSTISDRQQIVDGEHLKLLSIFHFIVGGFSLLGILFLIFHYLMMSAFFLHPEIWKSQKNAPQIPKDFFNMFIWFYFFMGSILLAACVCNILSGIFLRQRRHRLFSIVVGGLNCLQIPFGTILGVFTIMILSRSSVRESYGD